MHKHTSFILLLSKIKKENGMRNLYDVLCASEFSRVTYGMYNKLDDERFMDFVENKYNVIGDIENYHYVDLKLTEDEQKLAEMKNKALMDSLRDLIEKLSVFDFVKCYINIDIGLIRVIKPVNMEIK